MATSIQKKGILKTVVLIVLVMGTILGLFLNKITTPRYLSHIQLKINKLEFLKNPIDLNLNNQQWLLVYHTQEQEKALMVFREELREYIKEKTENTALNSLAISTQELPYNIQESIGIIKPNGLLVGYFKPPFDDHKMILTFSSIFTHR
jgi:flagellar biosynthesis component FlhA